MSKEVVETFYGKYSRFDVVKETSTFGSPKFHVRKDGKPHKGSYSSLSSAVNVAEQEAKH